MTSSNLTLCLLTSSEDDPMSANIGGGDKLRSVSYEDDLPISNSLFKHKIEQLAYVLPT
jgi:hypothetical protein